MPQIHRQQFGLFHVTTKTQDNIPWCIQSGVPEHLINTLVLARNMHKAKLHAFCILPNHIHVLVSTGEKGLSKFMQAFKSNSVKELRQRPDGLLKTIRWQAGFYDERIRDER